MSASRAVICRFRRMSVACAVLACIALPAAGGDWQLDGIERIVAISDVHGDFDAMAATIRTAGLLDDAGHWAGGSSHLVITGDLLDRGADSRKVMDLVMALEPEAAAAGGAVHQLLGNHEVMNLAGDLRYVAAGEYAAFADDEDPEEREHWFQLQRQQGQVIGDEAALRADFNARYPPGFFGHRRAFRSDGVYGQWLLQKPVIVVINGTAFVHGGLSPGVAEFGLDGVNGRMMAELLEYVVQLEVLFDAGLLDPGENFYRHGSAVEAIPLESRGPPAVTAAIETVIRLSGADIHDLDSPLWYRGNVGCGSLIENDRIAPALLAIGAQRVVIGHTPTLTRQVLTRLDGRVIEIDTGMLNAYYGGTGNALVIEGDSLTVLNEQKGEMGAPADHPRRVGMRDASISAADLESILANGEIVQSTTSEDGTVTVRVSAGGRSVNALFRPDPRSRGFVPELAAYRLDRLLELDMVPVTVRREIGGDDGVLQFLPASTINETERSARQRGSDAWCPLPEQWNAMYIFDALIHNPGRSQQQMLYSQDNWQLILNGHGTSFANNRGRPEWLQGVPLSIGIDWLDRLRALDEDAIDEQFGDSLDRRRRNALEARRDALLRDASGS